MILDWPVPQLSTQLLHSPEIESWSFMTTLTLAWLPETTDSDQGKYSQHVDVDVLWGIKTARLINCALRIWSLHAANMCHNAAMISRTIIRLIVGDQIFHSTKIVLQWFPILSPWISSLNLPSMRKNKGIMYFCKCGDNTTYLVKKDVAKIDDINLLLFLFFCLVVLEWKWGFQIIICLSNESKILSGLHVTACQAFIVSLPYRAPSSEVW